MSFGYMSLLSGLLMLFLTAFTFMIHFKMSDECKNYPKGKNQVERVLQVAKCEVHHVLCLFQGFGGRTNTHTHKQKQCGALFKLATIVKNKLNTKRDTHLPPGVVSC